MYAFPDNNQILVVIPVSYTHLDVYKRQSFILLFQFLRFGGHNAVKLGILREVIHKRHNCGAIEQQPLALAGVCYLSLIHI